MLKTSTTEYHKNLFQGLYCFYQAVDCGLYLGTGDPCLVYQDKMTKNKVKAQRKFMIGLLIANHGLIGLPMTNPMKTEC